MPTLDIISVNLWQILISLLNLCLLFLILKRFLFKPVKAVFAKRGEELDSRYAEAEKAAATAEESKREWERRLCAAKTEANDIVQAAAEKAKLRGEKIVKDAEAEAEALLRAAKTEAEQERRKATEAIKREIVEVSEALTEKILEREINEADHRNLIDSFLSNVGDENA